ncbi:MAG: hypothetical protein K6B74_13005 [Ruminococcus sp.]|nr:hypothetical protein [Ruminococcus sp.]
MTDHEYIKCRWESISDDEPVLLFYEIDPSRGRLAVRVAEVFSGGEVRQVFGEGVGYDYGVTIPTVEEINADPQFFAEKISRDEFEEIYGAAMYQGKSDFF